MVLGIVVMIFVANKRDEHSPKIDPSLARNLTHLENPVYDRTRRRSSRRGSRRDPSLTRFMPDSIAHVANPLYAWDPDDAPSGYDEIPANGPGAPEYVEPDAGLGEDDDGYLNLETEEGRRPTMSSVSSGSSVDSYVVEGPKASFSESAYLF